jgi:predicted membrane-bound spermidine synthase
MSIAAAFCISGAAGLVFEVVWFHRAGLVLGNSTLSTSIVLASFMAGIAAGNALVGWRGTVVRRPLRVYAALETAVAVSGIGLTYLLPVTAPAVIAALRDAIAAPWLATIVRALTAFAMLAVPATAMGATLPLLVANPQVRGGGFGWTLGRLYGWNTLGAVAGVLVAELVLIPRAGVLGSAWAAGLLNMSAAAVALWLAHRCDSTETATRDRATTIQPPSRGTGRLLSAAFLTGAVLLALEILWFRFLSMFVVNSSLAVALMLAVVLVAIALGGLAAAALIRRAADPRVYLPLTALAAGVILIGSYGAFGRLGGETWTADWYRILWFAAVMTFPVSLASGVLFTLTGDCLERALGDDLRAASRLTVANTVGALLGPLVATFVLLPRFGIEASIFLAALCYFAVALLTLPRPVRAPRFGALMVYVMAAVAGLALLAFPWGLMRRTYLPRSAAKYAGDGSQIVASREGPSETVLLMEQSWLGRPVYYRLVTNGFSMSGTHLTGKRYMRDFLYWPKLLQPAALRRVLVLCYGVGTTVQAATDLKEVASIDVVEISRDVVAMSDVIYPPAERPLEDPRVRLHLEDGRQWLETSRERFDVITGEPPPPLTPGAVNLYSREFFRLVYDHLADGGTATYWLPVAQNGAHDVAPIIKAFCAVFDDCSLWNGTPFDWMLVGTRRSDGAPDLQAIAAAWNDPVLGPRLREVGFERPEQVGATFLGDAAYLNQLTAAADPLTDDHPRRILPGGGGALTADPGDRAASQRFLAVLDTDRAQRAFTNSPFIQKRWPAALLAATLPEFDHQRLINRVMLESADPLGQIEALDALLTTTTLRRLPLWMLGSNDVLQAIADTGNDGTGMVEYQTGVRALAIRNYTAAANNFAASEKRGVEAPALLPLRVYALCRAGRLEDARHLANGVRTSGESERHFWAWMKSTFDVAP